MEPPTPPEPWPTDRAEVEDAFLRAHRMATLGRLASGLAHELNNSLAAVIAFSQLIRRNPALPDALTSDADRLVEEADRTRRIAQGLLEFVRHRDPERHPTPVRALVTSSLELLAPVIATGRVAVEVDIPDDLPPVPLDRALAQQALLVVVLDAVEAARAVEDRPGHLWIHAAPASTAHPPGIRLTIADDRPDDRRDPGAIEALNVARTIVERHGGTLRLEDRAAGRAAVEIVLPTEPTEPAGEAAADALAPPPTSGRADVLVVDDDRAVRRFASKALALAGYAAVEADSGETALALLRDRPFDAVLCDHRMAGMSGPELYDAALAVRPELAGRFVLMSGDLLDAALAAFADAHGLPRLTKPFDIDTVGRAVRAIVGEPGGQPRG